MPPIDHVMVLVADLDAAARHFETDHGLIASPGGRHAGMGTANMIVPLGDDYIELIAVVDPDEAAGHPAGQFFTHRLGTRGEGIVAVCLRTDDAAGVSARTGSAPLAMSRTRPDGVTLRWELIAMSAALTDGLPFFITWALDGAHPARTPAEHPNGASGIAWVEVGGDPGRVRDWVGADSALRFVGGEPGPRRYAVTTAAGELVLS